MAVLPCCASGKEPLTEHGFKDATSDPGVILALWKIRPGANVAIRTGNVSKLLVVDVDPRHGGNEQLAGLEKVYGTLPADYVVETSDGGRHFYFRLPDGIFIPCSVLADGIDIKCENGYVIAPPSVHPSGHKYAFAGCGSAPSGPPPSAPEWLLAQLARKAGAQAHSNGDATIDVDELQVSNDIKRLIREGVPKGRRSEAVFGVLRSMVMNGHSDEEIMAVTLNPQYGISEKPREKGTAWLRGQCKCAREKPDRDDTRKSPQDKEGASARRSSPGGDPLKRIMNAEELVNRELPEPRWIVPGLIPEGLTLFAGKSKMGKSWFSLQTAVDVASGQGDVLYLALEDTPRRLQDRLLRQCGNKETVPPRLELAAQSSWPRLDADGLAALRRWLSQHDEARLIIVDTFAKVKPIAKRNANAYDDDYAALAGVKQLADEFNVGVLIVHHLRKMPDADDPFNEISGTTGLVGCADTIMVLKRARNSNSATLHVTGRDVEEREIPMTWFPDRCRWSSDDPSAETEASGEESSEVGKIILELLRNRGPLTMKEIVTATGKPEGTIKSRLSRLVDASRLVCNDHKYYLSETNETTKEG